MADLCDRFAVEVFDHRRSVVQVLDVPTDGGGSESDQVRCDGFLLLEGKQRLLAPR